MRTAENAMKLYIFSFRRALKLRGCVRQVGMDKPVPRRPDKLGGWQTTPVGTIIHPTTHDPSSRT